MPGVKGAGAYARKRAAMEIDPLKRAQLASRYSKGRARLVRFENLVKPNVDAMPGVRAVERNNLMHLARKVYGLSRRHGGEILLAYVARAGADWFGRACDPDRVMATIVRSLSVRGVRLSDAEQAQLRKDIESNREGVMSDTEKQVIVNAAPAKRKSPRRFVKLEENDLSNRVREYFARNIDDARLAESAAAELMSELRMGGKTAKSAKAAKKAEDGGARTEDGGEKAEVKLQSASCKVQIEESVEAKVGDMTGIRSSESRIVSPSVQGERAEVKLQNASCKVQSEESVERQASGVKRSASSVRRTGFSLAEIDQPSAFGLFTRKQATDALRECLAVHEPIVRRAVALRLTRLLSPEEIAAQLELELEDVHDILTQMRPWVHRFTGFFDQDRYWQDDARPYSIPPLPGPGV